MSSNDDLAGATLLLETSEELPTADTVRHRVRTVGSVVNHWLIASSACHATVADTSISMLASNVELMIIADRERFTGA